MADGYGYGDYGGLPPYGYATGGAAFMSGAMPGLNRTVGLLAQMPLIKQQAEQMAQQQALQNMKTLVEILNLPDPMGGAALEQFGPKLGVDAGLIATLKKSKEDQRREIAGFLQEAGVTSGPGAQMATRILQQNPTKAFELWNKAREQKIQRERMAGLEGMYTGQLEVPRHESPQGAPGAAPTPERPYPPAAYGEPPPPPAPPSVAPGAPTGAIAPGAPQPMPTEGAGAAWQRHPDYLRAKTQVETAMRAIENENSGFFRVTSRGGLDEAERKHFTEIHKQRIEGFGKQLEAAQKALAAATPEYATNVEVRDEFSGKTVIRAISKQGERMGEIGAAPFKPQSPEGQAIKDREDFKLIHGADSEPAQDMRAFVEMKRENATLGVDEARLKVQKLEKEIANMGKADYKDLAQMRDKFIDLSKAWNEARSGYTRINVGITQDDVAGDIALIYGYAKMLDPTGAVREGDYNSIAQNPGVPGWLQDLWRGAHTNRRLDPNRRREIYNAARRLYNDYEGAQRFNATTFRGLAKRQGWSENEIEQAVPNLVPPAPPTPGENPATPPAPPMSPPSARTGAEAATTESATRMRAAIEALNEAHRKLQEHNSRALRGR